MAKLLTKERIETEILDVLKEEGFEVTTKPWNGGGAEYKVTKGKFDIWFEFLPEFDSGYMTYAYTNRRLKHPPRILEKIREDYAHEEAERIKTLKERNQLRNAQGALKGFGIAEGTYFISVYSDYVSVKMGIPNFLDGAL